MPTPKKISQLDAASSIASTDEFEVNQSGNSRKATPGQIVEGAASAGLKFEFPFSAGSISPRSANGCAVLATTNGASNQPDIEYLAFDGAAKEYARLPAFKLPVSYNSGTITAVFTWRRASGTGAANVVWGIRAVAVGDDSTPAANFGSDATVTDAASTTTVNLMTSGETGACTIAGTPAPGKTVFIEIFRDGASGSDTLDAVDAWLSAVTVFITVNQADDS